jgi:hypothetical protein
MPAPMPEPPQPRRLTAPWTAIDTGSAFRVETADGQAVAWIYYGDVRAIGTNLETLTRDEARRVAAGVVRLPSLLRPQNSRPCGSAAASGTPRASSSSRTGVMQPEKTARSSGAGSSARVRTH